MPCWYCNIQIVENPDDDHKQRCNAFGLVSPWSIAERNGAARLRSDLRDELEGVWRGRSAIHAYHRGDGDFEGCKA